MSPIATRHPALCRLLVAALALLALGRTASASPSAYGVPWEARHGLDGSAFQAEFDALIGQGYRLVDVAGTAVGGAERFAGLWEKRPGSVSIARVGVRGASYQAEFDDLVRRGFRPVVVNGYGFAGEDRYVAVFEQRSGPAWVARHGMSPAVYQSEFERLLALGYRLVHVSGYEIAGAERYAAIWEQRSGPEWQARHGMTAARYQAEFDALVARGFRLVQVSGYAVAEQERYAAIWERAAGEAWSARHGLTSQAYQSAFDDHLRRGYRLARVSAYASGGGERYAAIWHAAGDGGEGGAIDGRMAAYLATQGLPGLSLAIAKDGRLVYARGFGHADAAGTERVDAEHRFRVASVSKPITAIAILRLVEQGRLSLRKKVFGPRGILGEQYGLRPYGKRLKKITVRHLLEQTSGFTSEEGDPMFANFDLDQHALVSWVLDNQPPRFKPGKGYAYSNFGYLLLGRIIEQVTGLPYETYVASELLAPAGIGSMQIAGDTLAERAPGEVVYDDPWGWAYAMHVSRMDAHGGWIATPSDLLRLLVRVDGSPSKPDLLSPAPLAKMWSGSAANPGYGLGWMLLSDGVGHNGAMPGSLAFLVQRDDGFAFAVLANGRPGGDPYGFELKAVIEESIAAVEAWPGDDLF